MFPPYSTLPFCPLTLLYWTDTPNVSPRCESPMLRRRLWYAGLSPGILYAGGRTLYTCNSLATTDVTDSQVGQCAGTAGCATGSTAANDCFAITAANNPVILAQAESYCGTLGTGQGYGVIGATMARASP